MSSNSLVPSFRYVTAIPPGAAHETVIQTLKDHDKGITDLQTAVPLLKKQISELKTATSTLGTTENITENIIENSIAGFGTVNNQSGETSYTTQTSDNGALLLLSDGAAIAVTLNPSVATPWLCFAMNWGAGLVTFTPGSGTISYIGNLGAASMTLATGYLTMIVFDGTNFWAATLPVVPVAFVAVANQFLTAYNATTGQFSAAQPAFSNISGVATNAQLPAGSVPLPGTSGSLGGSPMTDGQTITVAVSIPGATTSMVALCSPQTYPGDGFVWDAYVSAAGTVTVRLTATISATPSASLYNVRVLQ